MTRRWLGLIPLTLTLTLALAWLGGFLLFLTAAQSTAPPPAHADGIVALTGAPGRIDAALRLLADGRADRLLVSGVAPGSALEDIAHGVPGLNALGRRTTLGHIATTTRGNARETAAWARAGDMHSLMIVTSEWHMPRAMAELSRAMPDLQLYPVPVSGAPEHRPLASFAGWRLLAAEYTKWLVVAAGLPAPDADKPRKRSGPPPSDPASGESGAVSRTNDHRRQA